MSDIDIDVEEHDHDQPPTTPAELRELLDRLAGLEESASEFDGHNEMACQSINEATDDVLEAALGMDNCVVHRLGLIGALLPEIASTEDQEHRWDLMNEAFNSVLVALDHVEQLANMHKDDGSTC